MSIYPVKLCEWFPAGDPQFETAYFLVKITRCYACGHKLRWKSAIAHHSICFGYGDMWCGWKCCKSNKIAKTDKRREKRLNRKIKPFDILINEKKIL